MAGEFNPNELTIPASADLSTFQYRAVTLRSDGSAGTYAEGVGASSNGTIPIGVLTNKPGSAGRGARVCVGGITKIEAGSAVAAGDMVMIVGQAGRAVGVNGASQAGTFWFLGRARTRAAASGDIFEVMVQPGFYRRD